jgi:hypothetical protein
MSLSLRDLFVLSEGIVGGKRRIRRFGDWVCFVVLGDSLDFFLHSDCAHEDQVNDRLNEKSAGVRQEKALVLKLEVKGKEIRKGNPKDIETHQTGCNGTSEPAKNSQKIPESDLEDIENSGEDDIRNDSLDDFDNFWVSEEETTDSIPQKDHRDHVNQSPSQSECEGSFFWVSDV